MCSDLAPERLSGGSPFGDLDLEVADFGVADCIDVSRADLSFRGSAGDSLAVRFSYPVTIDDNGLRFVATSFDAVAALRYTPAGGPAGDEQDAMIHIDVTTWHEGRRAMHDLDITVSITDPAYATQPVRVSGTFCRWMGLFCASVRRVRRPSPTRRARRPWRRPAGWPGAP